MGNRLPEVHSAEEFEQLRADERAWLPAVEYLARRHGITGRCRLFSTGSAVVCQAGDRHVIKLHEPWHRDLCDTEAQYLSWMEGRLPVASPAVVAVGDLEGWGYIVMSRLPGLPLSEARADMAPADLVQVAIEAGRLAACLQALAEPPPSLCAPPWRQFIAGQRRACLDRHRAQGLPAHLLDTLEAQLGDDTFDLAEPVFLHTELTDTNLMVAQTGQESGRAWQLSGVFDFEPSMLGHPLYDLPSLTIFVCRGQPEPAKAALLAYGVERCDTSLARKLLALTLLHRYSHIGFFLRIAGVPSYPDDWTQVRRALIGF